MKRKQQIFRNCLVIKQFFLFGLFSLALSNGYSVSSVVSDAKSSSIGNCTLLPLSDNVQGGLAYDIFLKFEEELKTGYWCNYRSNSSVLYIFSQYRDNLHRYLENPGVISTVSRKLNAGTIFRLKLDKQGTGILAKLVAFSGTGEVNYLNKKEVILDENINEIMKKIRLWLGEYKRNLPFKGVVSGVVGKQLTIELRRFGAPQVGQEFSLYRQVDNKVHPQTKTVVEWKDEFLGVGKIINVSNSVAIGEITRAPQTMIPSKGDWVRYSEVVTPQLKTAEMQRFQAKKFGRLGTVGLNLNTGNNSTSVNGATSQKVNGMLYGFDLRGELWVTRNYFVHGAYGMKSGSLKKSTDTTQSSSLSASPTEMKLMGGYRFLPLHFFWGPQLEGMLGYASYTYDIEASSADGIGETTISGFPVGFRLSLPFMKKIRGSLRGQVLMMGKIQSQDINYGNSSSVSHLEFELGGSYRYAPLMSIDGGLQMTSGKSKFSGTYSEVRYQSTSFKVGVSYLF